MKPGARQAGGDRDLACGAAVYTPRDFDLTAIIADIVELVDRRTEEAN